MKVIADTGPVIALAKVGQLQLLQLLFGNVHIPFAVYKELMAQVGDESKAIDDGLKNFIKILEVNQNLPHQTSQSIQQMGKGEKEAILLAQPQAQNPLLIIDDKAGRNAAKQLGIPITGSVGVVIMAKNRGLIGNAGTILLAMRDAGYWLSDRIIIEAKKLANE